MKLMNKKATSAEQGVTLATILGAIVLVIALIAASYFIWKYAIPFYNNLPDFNETATQVSGVEILRYDVQNDAVQYYSPATENRDSKWTNFRGRVSLDEKNISYDTVLSSFRSYYFFGSRTSNSMKLNEQYAVEFNIEQYSGKDWKVGDVMITIISNGQVQGFFILSLSSDSFGYPSPYVIAKSDAEKLMQSHADWASTIKSQATAWRDSVLKNPISISYNDNVDGQSKQIQVCPDSISNGREVIVNLQGGVTFNGKCS